jgi:hypothetical protein
MCNAHFGKESFVGDDEWLNQQTKKINQFCPDP